MAEAPDGPLISGSGSVVIKLGVDRRGASPSWGLTVMQSNAPDGKAPLTVKRP